ncbi:MAG: hypothetical protein AMXMBFR84_02470 [Candidatus Hydrogenedentota bacterium]
MHLNVNRTYILSSIRNLDLDRSRDPNSHSIASNFTTANTHDSGATISAREHASDAKTVVCRLFQKNFFSRDERLKTVLCTLSKVGSGDRNWTIASFVIADRPYFIG